MQRRRWIVTAIAFVALTGAAFGEDYSSRGFRDIRFVLRKGEGRVRCEAELSGRGDIERRAGSRLELNQINHLPESGEAISEVAAGLKIVLRGTAQLERYPEAKAAFIRAADLWESLLTNAMTVYIDVDFGPAAFGEPFSDPETLGSTSPDVDVEYYSDVRSALTSLYRSSSEIQSLPHGSLPTDIGPVSLVVAPSPVMRELGLLRAATSSDPASQIGFNSAFSWDFDPTDGIEPFLTDFSSTATHEIGHALGFLSAVGFTELDPSLPLVASVWDFNRFRPGPVTFASEDRVLSSGGDHDYWSQGSFAPLSTGRPDGSGGDHQQASHWKANELFGYYVGIMDPTLASGEHDNITGGTSTP